MTKLKGSKVLGRWVNSEKVEVLERLSKTRVKDAMIVLRMKASGKTICVVPRKHKDSYAHGEKTRSKARQKQVEEWPIDAHLTQRANRHKPDYLVIFLVDTEDYWVSRFEDWMDPYKRSRRTVKYNATEVFSLPSHLMQHVPSERLLSFV